MRRARRYAGAAVTCIVTRFRAGRKGELNRFSKIVCRQAGSQHNLRMV